MKNIVLSIIFIIPITLLSGSAWGADICVDPGGGGNFTSIQDALDEAEANGADDVIQIVQGTYSGSFSYSSSEGKNISLEGGYTAGCANRETNPTNTILDGGGSVQVLALNNDTDLNISAGSISVDGFTIKNGGGSGTYYGAGVLAQSQNSSTSGNMDNGDITIINNIIKDNTGVNSGAIYLNSTSYHGDCGNITVANNVILDNECGMYGGGLYAQTYVPEGAPGTITFYNNIIAGNSVTEENEYGGGIYLTIYSSSNDEINISNNTITGNNAYSGGGVFLSPSGGTVHVYNNIIWGNTAVDDSGDLYFNGSYTSHGYNNNYNEMAGSWTAGSSGNIDTNPRLSSDYHLKSGSPCIDTGTNTAPSLPSTDIDGDNRIIDGDKDSTATVDMGADEYLPKASLSILLLLLN